MLRMDCFQGNLSGQTAKGELGVLPWFGRSVCPASFSSGLTVSHSPARPEAETTVVLLKHCSSGKERTVTENIPFSKKSFATRTEKYDKKEKHENLSGTGKAKTSQVLLFVFRSFLSTPFTQP